MSLIEQNTDTIAVNVPTPTGTGEHVPMRALIPMEALRRHARYWPQPVDDDKEFDFSANLNFPTREEYLSFVREWKSEYAGVVLEIRNAKADRAKGTRESLRIVARLLLALRAAGKAEARLSYARIRAEQVA